MKKPLTASAAKKKNKTREKQKAKNPSSLKSVPPSGEKQNQMNSLIHQMKTELLDKIDQKFNALNHRFDRIEDGIDEVLDELRATEALLESESEPYEGQA